MERLTTTERDTLARLDGASMLARTKEWAAINSGTRNLAGNATMAGLLADAAAALPGSVRLVPAAPVDTVAVDGRVEAIGHGDHLHLSVRPGATRRLLFFGHMDTVYGVDHPFQSLTTRDDGALVGPGVTDMKGGLAVMLAALSALEAGGVIDAIGYDVLVNSDEETGSLSSAALIGEVARGKHAAFGYEPALPDGTLAGARGGTGNFSVVVRGRSAHAGRNPEDGRNALVAAADLAVRLAAARAPTLAVNPARIDGGGPNNVVPDHAVLRVNFRPRDAAAIEAAGALLREIADTVARDHDVAVEVHGLFNRPPKPVDAAAERLFALVADAGADLGLVIGRRDTGGVCDGNNVAAAGVPVVDTMGVRGGAIHSSDEYFFTDSLVERAALSALSILRLGTPA
ncbi:hydrolase [Sphingomonas rubra]|uniref:Glutamate carboxypeptidase n=1 Tax=Sphingomonas rubra TaxID=634430 RepID=A0A1I5PP71_9SPHN|nr:hydrolase [Sphingomonas rubra]SFP35849.1 glutamate carboxypeptidase [Sphingomonas rubra]